MGSCKGKLIWSYSIEKFEFIAFGVSQHLGVSIIVQSKGETLILATLSRKKSLPFIRDWRRCCERIFKHINAGLGSNGKSWVITDSRCNLHLTSSECFERAVRLPAALRGIRQADGNVEVIHTVEDSYLNLAENDVIVRAHSMSYIQKLKRRCMAAPEDQVVPLTDDSDGNGGEDTSKSFLPFYLFVKKEK